MKIAFILDAFPVLSETFILGEIIGLLDRGHEVEIFARYKPPQTKVHSDVGRYHLLRKTHYLETPPQSRSAFLRTAYVMAVNFHRCPLKIIKWVRRWRRGTVSWKRLNLLIPFLSGGYDIIHCHFGPNGILGIFLKESGIRAPVVTSFYGYDLSLSLAEGGTDIYGEMLRKGDLFLPISEYFKRRLIELGCDERKIAVYHMGVDLSRFNYAPRRVEPGGPVRLLTVGRLVEKKGYEYALRAVAQSVARGRNIRYVIAGEGPLRDALRGLAGSLGMEDRVRFMGAVAQHEVRELFREAHLFVLPSVTARNGDQEGIPTALMEAQACGLPVLSTRHSGIPEVVADEKSGFLVPEKDPDALAERLEYFIEHPEMWPGMGMVGRRVVEEEYDRDTLIERLLGMYRDLIAKKT